MNNEKLEIKLGNTGNFDIKDYLTKENWAQLNNNLDFLYSIGWLPDKVTLGINLCEEINDYNYFKEAIKKYNEIYFFHCSHPISKYF